MKLFLVRVFISMHLPEVLPEAAVVQKGETAKLTNFLEQSGMDHFVAVQATLEGKSFSAGVANEAVVPLVGTGNVGVEKLLGRE